jgi:menaquinone-9 beta-reductase
VVSTLDTDVLVVGSGPAGSAVALRLAQRGHRVTMVEKRPVPRHKACGDVLTPRSLAELAFLDIDPLACGGRRLEGVRMIAAGRELIEPWPSHPDLPAHGAVLRRDLLDELLRDRVRADGGSVLMGHEAIAPVVDRGFVRGAVLATADGEREIRSRFVVVADGANSRFGRALGTTRERDWPYGIATRSYWHSPRTNDTWLETRLGIPDANGNPIAGYGWIAPVGDGTVNIGIGLLSSYRDVRGVNALKLLDTFARQISDAWQIVPSEPLKSPTRFRVPLGGSVGPTMGPTFLVVGDAAGAANPFNGDGVNAALMTGRLAADVLDEALTTGNSTTLQRYPTLLADAAGQYDKVGRLAARFLGRPAVLRPMLRVGMRSDRVMGAALRIATGELRDQTASAGAAERAYALAATLSKLAPNW